MAFNYNNIMFQELFPNFPFNFKLNSKFRAGLQSIKDEEYIDVMITGFCDGDIIGRTESNIFIKVAYNESTRKLLDNEIHIMRKLQNYDFIPRLYCLILAFVIR